MKENGMVTGENRRSEGERERERDLGIGEVRFVYLFRAK